MTLLRGCQILSLVVFAVLTACSNGRGSVGTPSEGQEPPGTTQFTVGGTVIGLEGSGLILRNNGGDDYEVAADGTFAFDAALAGGAPYRISIAAQPTNPEQTCSVSNGSGTIAAANVTDVAVTCSTVGESTFTLGGTVTGLAGTGLVLQNNGEEELSILADGVFAFETALVSGATYNVTVASQPGEPIQTCTIANAAGTVGEADIADVTVTCATDVFSVGGTVTGLTGSGLVVQLNAENDRSITSNGRYEFPVALPSGTPFVVSVLRQPNNPTQACTLENPSGTLSDSSVTNVNINCVGEAFTVGGTVRGLEGNGLTLQLNGSDDIAIASNGRFTFATSQESGTPYEVTVGAQPAEPAQTCTVADASGTVGAGDVRNVRVSCSTNTYPVSGAVSGLLGTGLVLENSGERVEVESDGGFTFPGQVASGGTYDVAVRAQPSNPTQACTVTNGSGSVTNAPIENVVVTCTTSEFLVGGTVGGLAGSGLVLRNNGGDDLTIDADGSFTFPTALVSGATYDITIAAQPASPTQVCTLANAAGTVLDRDVTTIEVSCVTVEYTVGGAVSGLLGSGLVLQNNGADDLPIAADGAFSFSDSLPSETPYNVTVAAQPALPTQACTVTNGVGTIVDRDINNVGVACETRSFTISVTVSNLQGFDLRLANNGTDPLRFDFSTTRTFAVPVLSGQPYDVTITQQPIVVFGSQTCAVVDGSGTVGGENVTVTVQCD